MDSTCLESIAVQQNAHVAGVDRPLISCELYTMQDLLGAVASALHMYGQPWSDGSEAFPRRNTHNRYFIASFAASSAHASSVPYRTRILANEGSRMIWLCSPVCACTAASSARRSGGSADAQIADPRPA
eukprot:scaffold115176_cov19-Prasinocladus_malaysianus.AAC.1